MPKLQGQSRLSGASRLVHRLDDKPVASLAEGGGVQMEAALLVGLE